MKRAALALVAAASAYAALRAAPLAPEQALDRRSIGELEFSPDGTRLVFTVAEPVKGTTRSRSIWLLDLSTRSGQASDAAPRRLTFSARNDESPRWSPDGSAIAFLSDRDGGAAQLYLLPMRGGEAEKITDRKEAVSAFRWSPDGSRIALLMPEPRPDAGAGASPSGTGGPGRNDSRVVDKDARRARVWLLDVASKKLTQVTSGTMQLRQIEWLPSGTALVATVSPKPESDQWDDRIVTIDLPGGAQNEIAHPRGPFGGLAVSPDGATIAFTCARVDGPDAHDLCTVPAAGGTPKNITASSIDRPISQARWFDGDTIVALVARGFKSGLATITRAGRATAVDGLETNPSAYARSRSGVIAYAGETATRAAELWLKAPGSPASAVTTLNAAWTSIPTVAPEFLTYESFDGVAIEAALLLPPSAEASRSGQPSATSHQPSAMVVLVHGGPTGRWSDTFEPWGQLLVARGYAVFYPNIRGSVGYGQRFVEMNRGDWGGGDFKDVMAGVDAMIARGIADPNRLGIGGWSYGGYMAAWAITQTNRFKASVVGAPVIDLASEFGTENGPAYDHWFYGTPYEKLDGFVKSSPITFVKNAKTPALILQGESDTTDPIGQSQQFYRGLKWYGVESEFVVYPREPHGLREEAHLIDRLTRIVAWYDKYLRPSAASTAQPQ
jgi:dipeptidyl aminopeptidase/acylaminoacyl peptidase